MIPLENFASQKSVLTAVIESLLKMDISENEWRKALKTGFGKYFPLKLNHKSKKFPFSCHPTPTKCSNPNNL